MFAFILLATNYFTDELQPIAVYDSMAKAQAEIDRQQSLYGNKYHFQIRSFKVQ